MKKEKKQNLLKAGDMSARLKTLGYDVNESFLKSMPRLNARYVDKVGILKNGKLTKEYYYDPNPFIQFFETVNLNHILNQLKERGYNIDPNWVQWFPYKYVDGIFHYDLEQIISFINSISFHNVQAVAKELGYTIADEDVIYTVIYCQNKSIDLGITCCDRDTLLEYLEGVTNLSLERKLTERGYDISTLNMYRIKDNYSLDDKQKGYHFYDIDKVIAFINEHPRKYKNIPMKTEPTNDSLHDNASLKNTAIENISGLFAQSGNMSTRFPISKWYAEKHHAIADYTYVGQIYIDSIFNEKEFKLLWSYKLYESYCQDYDSGDRAEMLRSFENEGKREYISEAVLEIEDGMYIILTDGRIDNENEYMFANGFLFYQEGIHDPSEFLRFVADLEVYHSDKGKLGLLYHDSNGFNTHDFTIPQPKIDFNQNYNQGFDKIHNDIYMALSLNKSKGLVLLHGKPGTGKTTYIRYLINQIDKNKIFVPPNLTEMLSDPGFIPFLMRNPDSILFIEDAENVLRSREDNLHNQAVSNILNITDGLLSDCLNIQIVATFNTNLKNVDPALLRKGRLIAQYEFTELQSDRAEKLADSLKVWLDDTDNLTLADIYAAKGR